MRVRYSFSSRRTRRTAKIRKQRQKYPLIVQKIVLNSDIILQILDSRFILDTRNPELEQMIKEKGKKIIQVLNKSDLIDKKQVKEELLMKISPFVFTSCTKRTGIKKLRDLIKQESKKIGKPVDKDNLNKITVGIIGYPNTGKSSLINVLIGKKSAKTGSEAGFTKGMQKLKLTSDIQLLDSPGVIPNKEYSSIKTKAITKHVKVGGRSFSQVKNPELVISEFMKEYPNLLEKHYKIPAKGNSEILLEKLGRKKNFLKKGGEINEDKTARFILKEWQEGKIALNK